MADEDTRTPVTVVSATTNTPVADIAGFGKETNYPRFTMSDGSVAFIQEIMTRWNRKDTDGNWVQYDEDLFEEGTYCLSVQVRIEGEYGTVYVLADDWQLNIDGEAWTTVGPSIAPTYCYAPAYSPEITVKEDSGINGVSDDDPNVPVEYFNPQGVKVANPCNGIFIRRQGSNATKIIM